MPNCIFPICFTAFLLESALAGHFGEYVFRHLDKFFSVAYICTKSESEIHV